MVSLPEWDGTYTVGVDPYNAGRRVVDFDWEGKLSGRNLLAVIVEDRAIHLG
jgi:hypothetical protein